MKGGLDVFKLRTCYFIIVSVSFFVGTGAFILYDAPSLAGVLLTHDEINACAVMIAREDARGDYDLNTKKMVPGVLSQEDADDSLLLNEGDHPDILYKRDAYQSRFHLRTMYDDYVDRGIRLCLLKKAKSEKIEMPVLKVKDGYHIYRSAGGSAAIVKNGDKEPHFECMAGYHPSGNDIDGCVK